MTKRSVNLTLDGQEGVDIEPDDEIIIEKANFPAQIVRFEDKKFLSNIYE